MDGHDWYLDDVCIDQYDGIGGFPWNENFETYLFPPSLWKSFDLDGSYGSWTLVTWEAYNDNGINSACHWFEENQPAQNGWLVSPKLQLPAGYGAELCFCGKNILYYSYGTPNSVWLSTGSLDPADNEYFLIWEDTNGYDYWNCEEIDLSAWAGCDIYLAFRAQTQSHEWYVDNARVRVTEGDVTGPEISHYPLLNTLRDDIPHQVYAHAEDPSGVAYLGIYYSIDGGGQTWEAGTDLGGGNWLVEIPAQELGTTVGYVIIACDLLDNLTYSQGYQFLVDDPVWLYYDSLGQTGWAGWNDSEWELGVLFENPLWGTSESLQINKVTAAFRLADTVNLEIYSTDGPGLEYLTQLLDPQAHTVVAEGWYEFSQQDLSLDSHFFFVVFSGINATNGYAHDVTRNYPGNCFFNTGADWIDLANSGVWMMRVEVQSEVGFEAPELTIGRNPDGLVLQWTDVGASNYRIEATTNPSDPDSWSLFDTTDYTELGALGEDSDPIRFFRVIAEYPESRPATLQAKTPGPVRPGRTSAALFLQLNPNRD